MRRILSVLFPAFFGWFTLPSQAWAQGGDTCNTATALTGVGTFAYNTTGATNSGFSGAPDCGTPVDPGQDLFFQWTAPQDGDYLISTEADDYRKRLALYLGSGCSASCWYSSELVTIQYAQLLQVSAGDSFLIQVGGDPGQFGPATLTIEHHPCEFQVQDAWEDNDTCDNAIPIQPGIYTQLTSHYQDEDWYAVTIPPGQVLILEELEDSNSTDFYLTTNECGAPQTLRFGSRSLDYRNPGATPLSCLISARQVDTFRYLCAAYSFDLRIEPYPCDSPMDDSLEPNDTCGTPIAIGDGFYPDRFVSQSDADFYELCVGPQETLVSTIEFSFAYANPNLYLWDASNNSCQSGFPLAEDRAFYNTAGVQWRNPSNAPKTVILEVRVESFEFQPCNRYDLIITGADTCGQPSDFTTFCDPMDPNSTGQSTHLSASTLPHFGGGVWLNAARGPITQFGYFLVGTAFQDPGLPLSQGRLCLGLQPGQQIGRYNQPGEQHSLGRFIVNGVFQNNQGTGVHNFGFLVPQELPFPGNPVIQSGQTLHFQLWHRESGGLSNFSNGVAVTY